MRHLVAETENPYVSRTLVKAPRLAHKVIHRSCVELLRWISPHGAKKLSRVKFLIEINCLAAQSEFCAQCCPQKMCKTGPWNHDQPCTLCPWSPAGTTVSVAGLRCWGQASSPWATRMLDAWAVVIQGTRQPGLVEQLLPEICPRGKIRAGSST
jgi:hypothetical protein